MSKGQLRVTNGAKEADIAPSALGAWRRRGWDVKQEEVPKMRAMSQRAAAAARDDSAETLESDAPATATVEE